MCKILSTVKLFDGKDGYFPCCTSSFIDLQSNLARGSNIRLNSVRNIIKTSNGYFLLI